MNRTKVLGLGLSAIVAAMAHAQVFTTYNWTFTGALDTESQGLFSGQGQLTVQGGATGVVVAMTGSVAGFQITGLLPTSSFGGNDNVFPPTSGGITFTADSKAWNLYGNSSSKILFSDSGGYGNAGTFSYTPVPEPSTYAAFAALGLAGFGVWRRVRR